MAFWVVLLCLALPLLLLFKKLASPTLLGGRRIRDERAELEWLQWTLRRLRATLLDAERKQVKDEGVLLWLQEIKDAACDAEDVIDEFEYEELRSKVEEGGRTQGNGSSGSSFPPSNKAIVHKVKEIRRRLENIAKERNDLKIADVGGCDDQGGTQKRMIQTSSLLKEEVLGREKEREEILEFLLASDDEIVPSTIAITGMGGLGKTTLAQLVYNDNRIEEHFKLKMWVYMTADYDIVKLTREILSSDGHLREIFWGLENLEVYQRKLVEKLKGRRFLLVIDNLWDRDFRKWQSLCAPLIQGGKGSKILITTRDTKVTNICQTRKTVELEGLSFHACWMLFKKHAFLNGNSGEYPRLEAIGKQIVQKFKGAPLAATMIGGLLYTKLDESEWMRILESELWELEHGGDDILSVLKLSYEHLPPQMRQCFAYCSLFPKNYKFEKLELVQQWMAQGFLQTGGSRRMEDVGIEYFDDLFSRSFLQAVHGKFVMHDLIHDLALLILRHGHLITDNDQSHKLPNDCHKLRHLSLVMASRQPDQRDLDTLCRYRCLRTLAFFFPYYCDRFHIPHSLFFIFSLRTLRVLDLSCGYIEELPDSIGNLKHLRYLDLRRNAFKRLPETLCCLYKLQTLKLEGIYSIERLPQGISKLINLRHFEVEPELLCGVVGIGNLTCLQELESFPISDGQGINIEDLKDMNELRGALSIQNLHRVRSKEEAMRAMLNNKRHLHKLVMNWDESTGCGSKKLEEEVLEALVPPAGLKEFAIEGYDGENFPSWLEQQSLSKLESISLTSCTNWNSLPMFWCLPFLKRIEIRDCPRLRNLPSLPTTLKELSMHGVGVEELPEFYQPSQPISGICNNISPSLSILRIEIYYCPQLRKLPSLPTTLKELSMYSVGVEELPEFYQPSQPIPRICNNISPALSILRIDSCPALKSLQRGLLQQHLRNLTVFCIRNCEQLVHWPEGAGFQATLFSLQDVLRIEDCPKLMAFPDGSTLSASLKYLEVKGCPSIPNGSLFTQLCNLSSESIVYVKKIYTSFVSCYEEALQHMKTVDWFMVDEVGDDEPAIFDRHQDRQLLSLVYDKGRVWSWRRGDWVLAWRVRICGKSRKRRSFSGGIELESRLPSDFVPPKEWWRRRSPRAIEQRTVIHDDDNDDHQHDSSVSACLGEHHLPWASSVRWLVANDTSHGAFPSLNLPSLEGLWISCCRGTRPLLTDAQIALLTNLKELQVFDCPELTFSSLQDMIRPLPSLQHLTIEKCPKLLSSSSSCSRSASTLSSNAATLQTLFVDDAKLLGNAQFVRECLSSLRGLHIWHDDLSSFTAAMKDGLQSLGQSIQHLSFKCCPNLSHLPSDFWSLLPSLKALSIGYCPEFQHLPMGRLPALLEILVIHHCPVLGGRCKPPPSPGHEGQQQQQRDWSKIAHIPVIVNEGYIEQGTYREFLELRSKWQDF